MADLRRAPFRWFVSVCLVTAPLLWSGRAPLRAGAPPQPLPPDLVVWASRTHGLMYGWHLDVDTQPGQVLLRLSTGIPNVGAGPCELRGGAINVDGTQDVYQRIYNDDGSYSDRLAGKFIFHPEHGHLHFEDYAQYRLRKTQLGGGVGEIVATGEKVSFCLIDVMAYNLSLPGAPPAPEYLSCGSERQGISVGWSDVYSSSLPDQWIDVTNVPNGIYWLEVEVDPDNHLLEADENNNVSRIRILLRKPR